VGVRIFLLVFTPTSFSKSKEGGIMKKFLVVYVFVFVILAPVFAGGADLTLNSLEQKQGMIQGQNSTNVVQPVQTTTTTTSAGATANIDNLSASTGPASANISLNQNFEAGTIPRELIQGPGFVIPQVMNNFGPFTDTSWNIFPIGVGKTVYSEEEAKALFSKGKGVKSHSKSFTTMYPPTKKVALTDKLPTKGEVVGNVLVRGENSDNDTNEVLGGGLLDAMKMGATHLVILKNGANIENKASSFGIGMSNSLSIIGGGAGRVADAITGGTGVTTAKVGQRFYPYIHAIAVKDGDAAPPSGPIKPDIKISPQTKLLEKQEKEQTVTP